MRDEAPSDETREVTFWHDFVAGGLAGSASVIVGHPFDTIKVRMQTSMKASILTELASFTSLFRGITAPLSAATAINAIVFSSYGAASRLYDSIRGPSYSDSHEGDAVLTHDPWQKSTLCGSFAGFMQCFIICPMEHIKCRLQIQSSTSPTLKGPIHGTRTIIQQYGWRRLYQGWNSTLWREVPAFGMYFAVYDFLKDRANTFLSQQAGMYPSMQHTHTWMASMFAGGCAGSVTWAVVYPVDVIKTHIQTAPLDTPSRELSMRRVAMQLVRDHGYKYLFRGLGITLIRAFPVNGTIFPVYEFALMHVTHYGG
jgi:solute carrier family 25 (mitochondrial carnitine/acylcarnitine transporter), member 20/29